MANHFGISLLVSLITLPADVLEHHLFPFLSPSSAVAFSLACRITRKIFVRARFCCKIQKILEDIFKFDSVNFLVWFQEALKYPSIVTRGLSAPLFSELLAGAVFGICFFHFFPSCCFLTSFFVFVQAPRENLMRHAHQLGYIFQPIHCKNAAFAGKFELLTWLRENGCAWDLGTCSGAACAGRIDILQWARANGCDWDVSVCSYAARGGRFDILKWARDNGCPWNSVTCRAAAGRGDMKILKWARENGCEWNEYVCNDAASFGHMHILQWAHENGCAWSAATCDSAAFWGRLEVLQWLRESGCPWDKWVCTNAAYQGHLELLIWARENGCEWDLDAVCAYAAKNRHMHVIAWARGEEHALEADVQQIVKKQKK